MEFRFVVRFDHPSTRWYLEVYRDTDALDETLKLPGVQRYSEERLQYFRNRARISQFVLSSHTGLDLSGNGKPVEAGRTYGEIFKITAHPGDQIARVRLQDGGVGLAAAPAQSYRGELAAPGI